MALDEEGRTNTTYFVPRNNRWDGEMPHDTRRRPRLARLGEGGRYCDGEGDVAVA
jgi:hypothetical protein